MQLVDDDRAAVIRAARAPPFFGLLAQHTNADASIAPLLRLYATRKPDRAGAFVEVICAGRGAVQHAAGSDPVSAAVSIFDDQHEDQTRVDAAIRRLRETHSMCQQASSQLASSLDRERAPAGLVMPLSDDSVPSDLAGFLQMPIDETISERRNALRGANLALGTNAGSDAELLSYAACCCLKPTERLKAVQSRSTCERLLLCVDRLHDHYLRLTARLQ